MKARVGIVFLMGVLLVIGTGVGHAAEDVLAEILTANEIKVSVDPNYAPQSFIGSNGELEGFDVDIAKEVAKRLGVRAKFVTPDWDMVTAGKWGKRWDVSIGSMTITEDRMKVLHFTHPYYATPAQFAVHKDNQSIQTLSDLAGKRIGCISGAFEEYLNKTLKIYQQKIVYQDWKPGEVRLYGTDADAFQDLAMGDEIRLDAVLAGTPTIHEAIQKGCKGGCPFRFVGDPVFKDNMAFAIDRSRPRSETFLKMLNCIVRNMHADGTLTRLSMKWYGIDLTK